MDYAELDSLIAKRGPDEVVAQLAPFVTDSRKLRIEAAVTSRLDSVRIAVERPADPYNAAAVVRTAEAFGALHVHVVDAPRSSLHARRTTQGAYVWLHTYHHSTLDQLLSVVRPRGVRIFGAAMSGRMPIEAIPVDAPLCLLFGNEGTGLSEAALSACDDTFFVPMVGMSESLNLSVSAAVSLYTVTRAKRLHLGASGDLTGEALSLQRARYYARTVDMRHLRAL